MSNFSKTTASSFSTDYFHKIYGRQNNLEHESVFTENLRILSKFKSEGKLLDVGSAYGEFAHVARNVFSVYGIDTSAYAVVEAKKRFKGIQFSVVDVEKQSLPFTANFFDVVTCFDVIEHIKNTELLFSEAHRILNDKGVFVLTTPPYNSVLTPFIKAAYLFFPDDPTHINKKHYRVWKLLLSQAGFKPLATFGTILYGFPPSAKLRDFLSRNHLPLIRRPVFIPWPELSLNVYMVFEKN